MAQADMHERVPLSTSWTPLLQTLALYAARYRKPVSIDGLVADLPIKSADAGDELWASGVLPGAELFSSLAQRAGFQARLIERSLDAVSPLLLPCVLLLKNRGACILEQWNEAGEAVVRLSDIPDQTQSFSLEQLNAEYLGFAWLLKAMPERSTASNRADGRSGNTEHQHDSLLDNPSGGHWFVDVLWRSRGLYMNVILASVLINLFVMVTPLFTMNVYDRVVPNNALDTLWVFVGGVLIVYLADTLLKFLRTRLLELAARKADLWLSAKLFRQAMGLSMAVFPDRVGTLANQLREFDSVRQFLASATLVSLVDLPFTVIFLLMIGWLAGPLVWIPVAAVLILLGMGALLAGPLRRSVERGSEAAAVKNGLLIESLTQLSSLRTCNQGRQVQFRWEQACGESADVAMRSHLLTASLSTVTGLLVQLTTVLILLVGVYQIQDQQLTMGGLLAAVILASRAVAPMAQASSLMANYQQTRAVWLQLDGLMKLPTERSESVKVQRSTFNDSIRLDHASLRYGESPVAALDDVTLTIRKGERVGVIGRAGSGKSSLAQVLAGLYPLSEGRYWLDDTDARQIEPSCLRKLMSVQLQDAGLIRGTVRDNLLMRYPQASEAQIAQAVHLSGLDRQLSRLPAGLDTPLAEAGRGLSGGQKQALLLARTLLDQAPILVLDEPSSAMDSQAEACLRDRLGKHLSQNEKHKDHLLKHNDQTLILITHKQGLLALVDRLIVMDDGRVLMDGPRDQVLKALAAGASEIQRAAKTQPRNGGAA